MSTVEEKEKAEKKATSDRKAKIVFEWINKHSLLVKPFKKWLIVIKKGDDKDGEFDLLVEHVLVVSERQLVQWFTRAKKVEAVSACSFDEAMELTYPKEEADDNGDES